jgi:zinc protease
LHVAFHAGSATDPETLPLEVLLNILVGGSSSRLNRTLVEDEQIALAVGGYQMAGLDPGLVYFSLTLPPGADISSVESRLLDELGRVAQSGISDAELEKARNIMVADYWRSMSTINGKAAAIGRAELFFGDYQLAFSLPVELAALTVDQIQQVAADTFDTMSMTVGVLRSPTEEEAR